MKRSGKGEKRPAVQLDGPTVKRLLTEVGRRLHHRGLHVDIYLVGGAAMAFTLDDQRITADVDAIFIDSEPLRQEAAAVAREHNLPEDWLNNRAAMFLPGEPDPGAVRLDVEGLTVSVASPEHVLAMKMASFRPGKDQDDLVLLFRKLGIERPEQAADIALSVYGPDTVVLPQRPELMLSARAVLERMRRGDNHPKAKPASDGPRSSPRPDGPVSADAVTSRPSTIHLEGP